MTLRAVRAAQPQQLRRQVHRQNCLCYSPEPVGRSAVADGLPTTSKRSDAALADGRTVRKQEATRPTKALIRTYEPLRGNQDYLSAEAWHGFARVGAVAVTLPAHRPKFQNGRRLRHLLQNQIAVPGLRPRSVRRAGAFGKAAASLRTLILFREGERLIWAGAVTELARKRVARKIPPLWPRKRRGASGFVSQNSARHSRTSARKTR